MFNEKVNCLLCSRSAVFQVLPLVVCDVLVLHWDVEVDPVKYKICVMEALMCLFQHSVLIKCHLVTKYFHCLNMCPIVISTP